MYHRPRKRRGDDRNVNLLWTIVKCEYLQNPNKKRKRFKFFRLESLFCKLLSVIVQKEISDIHMDDAVSAHIKFIH